MAKIKNMVFSAILLILTSFLNQKNAYSQGITGASALIAIDEIEGSMKSIIQDGENAGNSLINNGAYQLTHLIYNFKETYKEILKSTALTLDQTAYNIFLNIKSTSNKIFQGATDFVDQLDNTVMLLHTVMSGIPFFSKKPIISKPVIPVFIRNSPNDEYEIIFTGSLLDLRSTMKINGKLIKPSEATTNKLVYHVEEKLLQDVLTKKRVNFELKIKYGWLSLKSSKYSFYAKIIPQEYGLVEVLSTTNINDTIKISRSETMPPTRTGGSNWRGKRENVKQTFTIYPSQNGNEIDISSVRLNTLENRYGYGAAIISKSPKSILIQQHARSKDKPYGGGGKVQSRLTFDEFAISNSAGLHTIQNIPLIFNDPLVVKLPKNTVALQSVKVTLFDGKSVTLTTENLNKNFEVEFRNIDKTLFIKSVRL